MTKPLQDKLALVTGASRGIGAATAIALAAQGARLAVSGSNAEKLAAFCGELGGDHVAVPANLSDAAAVDGLVPAAVEALGGRLDILVHAIAFSNKDELTGRFVNTSRANFKQSLDISCYSLIEVARRALPLMGPGSTILTLTYGGSNRVTPFYNVMGVAKAALESETAIWAQDLADSGITVNALLPGGATLTGMIPEGLPDSARDGLLSPEIVVPPLLWLCSDAAAAVTGKRLDARRWMGEQPGSQRTTDTLEDVGC